MVMFPRNPLELPAVEGTC